MINNALIIRANRGENIDDGLAEMERLGADMSGTLADVLRRSCRELRARARRSRESGAILCRSAEDDPGVGFEYLYRAARPALWARDVERAKEFLRRYTELGDFGPVADARMATLKAGVAALEGRSAEAIALYKEALRGWRAVHAVIDEALTGVDAAELLDRTDPAGRRNLGVDARILRTAARQALSRAHGRGSSPRGRAGNQLRAESRRRGAGVDRGRRYRLAGLSDRCTGFEVHVSVVSARTPD